MFDRHGRTLFLLRSSSRPHRGWGGGDHGTCASKWLTEAAGAGGQASRGPRKPASSFERAFAAVECPRHSLEDCFSSRPWPAAPRKQDDAWAFFVAIEKLYFVSSDRRGNFVRVCQLPQDPFQNLSSNKTDAATSKRRARSVSFFSLRWPCHDWNVLPTT